MEESELREKVLSAQSCLVLEATNRLSRVKRKVWEAKQARNYIAAISGKNPYAGLVFFSSGKRIIQDFGLDVITRVNGFDRVIALNALENAYSEAYCKDDAKVAEAFG